MPTINSDVDPEHFVSRHFGQSSPERLRQSETRRGRLERWAQVVGHDGVSLSLNSSYGETARVRFDGASPNIEIPSWEVPQPVTNIQREAYDFLMQRTMTLHEVGHVNYTDQEALEEAVSSVKPEQVEQFHTIWNALEDGAIESQLRGDFSVAEEIEVMNANYMGSHGQSKTYGVMDAILRACLDMAVYDTGDLRTLLDETDNRLEFEDDATRNTFEDEILPAVQGAIPDILSESDPEERTDLILALWTEIEPYIDADDEATLDDIDTKGNHATQDSGSGGSAEQLDDVDSDAVDDRIEEILSDGSASGQDNSSAANTPDNQARSETTDDGTVDSNQDSDQDEGPDASHRSQTTPTQEADITDKGEGDQRTEGTDDRERQGRENGANQDSDTKREGADPATDESQSRSSNQSGDVDESSNDVGSDEDATADNEASPESDLDNNNHSQRLTGEDEGGGSSGSSGSAGQNHEADSDMRQSEDEGGGETDSQARNPTSVPPASENSRTKGGSSGMQISDVRTDPDPEPALEDEYLDRVADEESRQAEDLDTLIDEVDAFARTLERLEEQNQDPTELEIPTSSDAREEAWESTRRQGIQLRQILEEQLKQERRSSWRRGRTRGRVDARSLPRIARSDPRVFRQRVSPDEKDYSAAIVLDRSGSMSGDIHHAEEAAAALAYALEEIDVETCVIDMFRGNPRLAKPYGRDVEPSLDSLLTGKTSGGTPLSKAVRLARERVKEGDGTPFCIVITDGQPDNEDEYKTELRKAPFPVLGVYLAFNKRGIDTVSQSVKESANLFDQRRIVTDEGKLVTNLRQLCREVMF